MSDRSTHREPDQSHPATEVVDMPPSSVSPEAQTDLAGTMAEEMAAAWRRGERPPVEQFLDRLPELWQNRDAAFRVICEEVCLRHEFGLPADPRDFLRRFPQWHTELLTFLDCHRLLQGDRSNATEALKDFELLAELGKGAQGQVYLAKQRSLGDRPVVLKISPCHGREHLSLARLQHTHIVPLYWVHDDPGADHRVLCMPYFGNLTLAGVMVALKDKPVAERTGQDLLDVLDRAQKNLPVQVPGQGPARPFIARVSYVQAISWIGACVADALQYAHDRGLVHLDIKPSNILLAADGQPMLLDFHLAREPVRSDGARPRGLGGTPGYMAPEQREVLQALSAGKSTPRPVDGRADQFSLGLVLYQVLGGPVPCTGPRPRLEECNPAVSPGLADIIHKCIAENPESRYADIGAMGADLRRHLAHQKLRGVRNRSFRERWRKWRLRQPLALSLALLFICLFAALGSAGYLLWSSRQTRRLEDRQRVQTALEEGERLLARRDFGGAVATLERGQKLAAEAHAGDLEPKFTRLVARAKRQKVFHKIHLHAELLRFRPAGPYLSSSARSDMIQDCRAAWEARERLLREAEMTDEADRLQLRTDLLDLALLWTHLKDRGRAEDRKESLRILTEAERLLGDSAVVRWEAARLSNAGAEPPTTSGLKTAWECYAVGRSLLHGGDAAKARPYLERAVRLEPGSFWPNFYAGVCADSGKRWQAAVRAFGACVALAPGAATAHYNRALALTKLKEVDAALSDFGRALELDAHFAAAAFGRALLYKELGRDSDARADLQRVFSLQADYPGARELLAELNDK